jgi:hypothetical protein
VVDHGILTKRSNFFRTARSQLWTSETKPTELPEQDPSMFALYLDCLYDRTMPEIPALTRLTNGMSGDDSRANIAKHWEKLIGLYVLACYLVDPATRNMAIDQIRRFYYAAVDGPWYCGLEKEVIDLILRSTPHGDALRNLFADFFVFDGEDTHTDLPKEWFVLLWRRSLSLREFDRLAVEEDELVRFR